MLVHDITELRSQIGAWRRAGERIAFVPTMGSLHAGHMSLVKDAQAKAERVVVSVFVNPLQFSAGEDFSRYPRSLEQDCVKLEQHGVDLVFAPDEQSVYPQGREQLTQVVVPGLSKLFCGEYRPGHFEGVTTVVCLLFNLVQPDVAVFGLKDYQQITIIRRMVKELHMPVEIVGSETLREPAGLAMSSRNAFLSDLEREQALAIYHNLCIAADRLRAGERDFNAIEKSALIELEQAGLQPQFFQVRDTNLNEPASTTRQFVIVVAAKLGDTRLIDNIRVDLDACDDDQLIIA